MKGPNTYVIIIDSEGNVVSDISLTDLRDALKGADGKDFSTLEADIEAILAKLDVALSTRAPKDEGETITIANNEDISGGKTAALKNFKRWTLYLKVSAAMDITIELSPDGGTTWYEIPESPISFSAAGDDVLEVGYDATDIKITGSTTDTVTAQIRGVY